MYATAYVSPRDFSATSMMPAFGQVPRWKESGRIEDGLFKDTDDLCARINDDFLAQMAKESKDEREKREALVKKHEEERKQHFLKDKWQKIVFALSKNYKDVDVEIVDPKVSDEIKRCMLIPSTFLRTKLVSDCTQCSKELWKTQEHYKPLRHPHDEELDFDGHFPEDHIKLDGFEEKTKEEKTTEASSLMYPASW